MKERNEKIKFVAHGGRINTGASVVGLVVLCLGLVSNGVAQTAGSVVISTTVTATAGTGASAVVCNFNGSAKPLVHMECTSNGAVVLAQDVTPPAGLTNGAAGHFSLSGNSVTWILQQDTTGAVLWQIAANGVLKNGSF